MNARVNITQNPNEEQWTFEHRPLAERVRSVGTVRPVRTLVGSFRMRQCGKSYKTTKTFLLKRKEDFPSCLCKQRINWFYDSINNKHQKRLHRSRRWRSPYFHTLWGIAILNRMEGSVGFTRARTVRFYPLCLRRETATRFPASRSKPFCRNAKSSLPSIKIDL